MGIRGLYTYVLNNGGESFEPFTLENAKIIIDGRSVSHQLFNLSQQHDKSKYIIGSDYEIYSRYLQRFFKVLLSHKVDFLLIINGSFDPKHRDRMERDYKKCLSNNKSFLLDRRDHVHYSILKDDVFLNVVRNLKIKFIKVTFSSNEVISVVSKILDYPILTSNSDFILYGNDCIFFKTVNLDEYSLNSTTKIECMKYQSDKFINSFPGLKITCLPLLDILMGKDNFNNKLLTKILKFRQGQNYVYSNQDKLQAAFNWLSSQTLESGVKTICTLMTSEGQSVERVKTFIEAQINKYTTFSTSTFKFIVESHLLEINEERIFSVKDKFFKFIIDDKNPFPSNELNDKLVERDDDVLKRNVDNIAPSWLIQCHSKGYIHSYIICIIGLRTFIPWFHLEDINYPSAYEMSIPLIELINTLVSSCMKENSIQPLTIMTRNNCNAHYREIKVDKYSKSLDDIRKLSLKERLKIINNALKVANSENFQDLPSNWRLYAATAIFWFKQDVEPKKNKNHLKAILLAMLFATVKKSISSDTYESFIKQYRKKINSIQSINISCNNEEDQITVNQAFEKISHNDIIMAANYLLSMVSNPSNLLNRRCSNISTETIHIYSQFEICLHFSKTLNTLLKIPYFPIGVENVLMRPLIYNLYLDFSKRTDVDEYIGEKLNYAPNFFQCYKILFKKIDSLLNE